MIPEVLGKIIHRSEKASRPDELSVSDQLFLQAVLMYRGWPHKGERGRFESYLRGLRSIAASGADLGFNQMHESLKGGLKRGYQQKLELLQERGLVEFGNTNDDFIHLTELGEEVIKNTREMNGYLRRPLRLKVLEIDITP